MVIHRSSQKGFTLVELLVTLIIAGLLITVGIPSISGVFNNFTAVTTAENLDNTLAYAREQALFGNQDIAVCSGDETCTGDWNAGWRVYVPGAAAGMGETLRVVDNAASNATIIFGGINEVVFNRLGESDTAVDFEVCSESGNNNANITLALVSAGYVNKTRGADNC